MYVNICSSPTSESPPLLQGKGIHTGGMLQWIKNMLIPRRWNAPIEISVTSPLGVGVLSFSVWANGFGFVPFTPKRSDVHIVDDVQIQSLVIFKYTL